MGELASTLFGQLERLDHVVHDFVGCMREGGEEAPEELESEAAQRLQEMLDAPTGGGPVLGPPVMIGSSPAIGLESLLGFLGTQGKTGVLRVRANKTDYMISVVRGDVVHGMCDPRPEGELLGSLLLARGAIHSDAMQRFFETCGASASRIVEALNGEELVPSSLLREVMTQQIQLMFDHLLAAESSEWCFHEGEATLGYLNLRVNVNRMLLESARGKDERAAPAEMRTHESESDEAEKPELQLVRAPLPQAEGRHRRMR